MRKADTRESLERVRIITEMRIRGSSRPSIIEFCRKTWKIKRAQVDNYIRKATEGMIEEASRDREELFAEAVAVNRDIRQEAYKILTPECMRVALSANRENAELMGLKETRIRVVGEGDDTGLEVLQKRKRELIEQCKKELRQRKSAKKKKLSTKNSAK